MSFKKGDTVKAKKSFRSNKRVFFVHKVLLPGTFKTEGWPEGTMPTVQHYDGKIGLARSEKELREKSKKNFSINSKWNDYVIFKTLLTERIKDGF